MTNAKRCNETIQPEENGVFVQCSLDFMHQGDHNGCGGYVEDEPGPHAHFIWPQMHEVRDGEMTVKKALVNRVKGSGF